MLSEDLLIFSLILMTINTTIVYYYWLNILILKLVYLPENETSVSMKIGSMGEPSVAMRSIR